MEEGEEKRGHADCVRLEWGSATRWASSHTVGSEHWRKSEAQGVGDRVLRKEKERKSDSLWVIQKRGKAYEL